NLNCYMEIYRMNEKELVFILEQDKAESIEELQAISYNDLLNTIPSYSAEQMSLNRIVWFLVVISGMLFVIFFFMSNVQRTVLYGILKAIGVKTSSLFGMMWAQMLFITVIALVLSVGLSQVFAIIATDGMPFSLMLPTTVQLSFIFVIIGFIGATLSWIQINTL